MKTKTAILAGILVLILGAECQAWLKKKRGLVKQLEDPQHSVEMLRVRVDEFAVYFGPTIEEAADEIIGKTSDPEIRRQALLWKINAIPACHRAALQSDPFGSLLDVWTFCAQMVQYFTVGAGKEAFGEWQPIAIDVSRRLEAKAIEIVSAFTGKPDVPKGRELVDDWVAKHPIKSPLFTRESALVVLPEAIEEHKRGTLDAVGSLEENVRNLSNRLPIYLEHLPRQARWEAELLVHDMGGTEGIEGALENFGTLVESVERAVAVVERVPEIVTQERNVALKTIQKEREALIEAIGEERVATIDELRKERIAILDAIRQERIAALEALRQERMATMKELEAITIKAIKESSTPMEGFVDRVFQRLTPLVVAFVAALFVFGILAFVLLRKRA